MNSRNFFSELKRRNVYKVAVAYIVAGWALSQGIAQVFPVSLHRSSACVERRSPSASPNAGSRTTRRGTTSANGGWLRRLGWIGVGLGVSISGAVVFTAMLFGIIHLEVGAPVALGAVILGLLAGELRRRSGSLLPAIIVHASFNCIGTVWH